MEIHNSRLHAIVEGEVQGVGFRMFVMQVAYDLHLTGWVRNLWNGDVEVLAEGDQLSLNELLSLLKKGPRASFVSNVQVEWQSFKGEFSKFQIKFSG